MWMWNSFGIIFAFSSCKKESGESNLPPSMPIFSVEPNFPTGLDNVKVTVEEESVDPNNHKLVYIYKWYKDGVHQKDLDGPILPFFRTSVGEHWQLEAYVSEVCICEPLYKSNPFYFSFVVDNTPPYMTNVQIEPSMPRSEDTLRVSKEFFEPDGDDVDFLYVWTINNQPMLCCVDEITPDMTKKGEKWGVFVFPEDEDQGLPLFHQVTIRNTPPKILSVQAEITEITESIDAQDNLQENLQESIVTTCVDIIVETFDFDEDRLEISSTWIRDEEPIYIGVLQPMCFEESELELSVHLLVYDGEESSEVFEYHLTIPE